MRLVINLLLLPALTMALTPMCRDEGRLRSDFRFDYTYQNSISSPLDFDFTQKGDKLVSVSGSVKNYDPDSVSESSSISATAFSVAVGEGPGLKRYGWAKQVGYTTSSSIVLGSETFSVDSDQCNRKLVMPTGANWAATVCKQGYQLFYFDGSAWQDRGKTALTTAVDHDIDIDINHEDYMIVRGDSASVLKLGAIVETVQSLTGDGKVATSVNCRGSVFAIENGGSIALKQLNQKTLAWSDVGTVSGDTVQLSSDVMAVGGNNKVTLYMFSKSEVYEEYKVFHGESNFGKQIALKHDHLAIADDSKVYFFSSTASTKCFFNQKLVDGACVSCGAGHTNGFENTEATCNAKTCAANEFVSNGACQPCVDGTSDGPVANAGDTECVCDPGSTWDATALICSHTICADNEKVFNHTCVPCDPGKVSSGADAHGSDTFCSNHNCLANEHVVSNVCTPCPEGSTNGAGDLQSGADTACDPSIPCSTNEFFDETALACAPCPLGTFKTGGSNIDPSPCEPNTCLENEHVSNGACQACEDGVRPAGDLTNGGDTACLCPVDYGVAMGKLESQPLPVAGTTNKGYTGLSAGSYNTKEQAIQRAKDYGSSWTNPAIWRSVGSKKENPNAGWASGTYMGTSTSSRNRIYNYRYIGNYCNDPDDCVTKCKADPTCEGYSLTLPSYRPQGSTTSGNSGIMDPDVCDMLALVQGDAGIPSNNIIYASNKPSGCWIQKWQSGSYWYYSHQFNAHPNGASCSVSEWWGSSWKCITYAGSDTKIYTYGPKQTFDVNSDLVTGTGLANPIFTTAFSDFSTPGTTCAVCSGQDVGPLVNYVLWDKWGAGAKHTGQYAQWYGYQRPWSLTITENYKYSPDVLGCQECTNGDINPIPVGLGAESKCKCGENRISTADNTCVNCPVGATRPAGDDPALGAANGTCLCGPGTYNPSCASCPADSSNAGGDDPCVCNPGFRGVLTDNAGTCTQCAADSSNAGGDDPCVCNDGFEGDGTNCNACPANSNAVGSKVKSSCSKNENAMWYDEVSDINQAGACLSTLDCSTKAATNGDCIQPYEDGRSIACCQLDTPVPCTCAENHHVLNNECVACLEGETRAAGDNPDNGNTYCSTSGIVVAVGYPGAVLNFNLKQLSGSHDLYDCASSDDGVYRYCIAGEYGTSNIFKSIDSGATWSTITGPGGKMRAIACSGDGASIFVSSWDNQAVYKATGHGTSGFSSVLSQKGIGLWVSSNGNIVMATSWYGKLWISTSSGDSGTFTGYGTNVESGRTVYATQDGQQIVVTGDSTSIYISRDGGTTLDTIDVGTLGGGNIYVVKAACIKQDKILFTSKYADETHGALYALTYDGTWSLSKKASIAGAEYLGCSADMSVVVSPTQNGGATKPLKIFISKDEGETLELSSEHALPDSLRSVDVTPNGKHLTVSAGGSRVYLGSESENENYKYNGQDDPTIELNIGVQYTIMRDSPGHVLRIVPAGDLTISNGERTNLPASTMSDAQQDVSNIVWTPDAAGSYYYFSLNSTKMFGSITVAWKDCNIPSTYYGTYRITESCQINNQVTLQGDLTVEPQATLRSGGLHLVSIDLSSDIPAFSTGAYSLTLKNIKLSGLSDNAPVAESTKAIVLDGVHMEGNGDKTSELFKVSTVHGSILAKNIVVSGTERKLFTAGGGATIAVADSQLTISKDAITQDGGAVLVRDVVVTGTGKLASMTDSTSIFEAVTTDVDIDAANSAVQIERSTFSGSKVNFDSSGCSGAQCKRQLIVSNTTDADLDITSDSSNKPIVKVIEGKDTTVNSDNGANLYVIDPVTDVTSSDTPIDACLPYQCSHKPLASTCEVVPGKGTKCTCKVGVSTYNDGTMSIEKQTHVEEILAVLFATAGTGDRIVKLIDQNQRYVPTHATPAAAKSNILLTRPVNVDGHFESEKTILMKPDSGSVCATFQTWLCAELTACHFENGTITAECDGTDIYITESMPVAPERRLFAKLRAVHPEDSFCTGAITDLRQQCSYTDSLGNLITYERCVQYAQYTSNRCECTGDKTSNGDGTKCIDKNALCDVNEHVKNEKCVPCPNGLQNAAGDDKYAGNTECNDVICGEKQRVSGGVCVACLADEFNLEGDVAVLAGVSQPDTNCCKDDEYQFAFDESTGVRTCYKCEGGTDPIRSRYNNGLKCCGKTEPTAECDTLMKYWVKVCDPIRGETCPSL